MTDSADFWHGINQVFAVIYIALGTGIVTAAVVVKLSRRYNPDAGIARGDDHHQWAATHELGGADLPPRPSIREARHGIGAERSFGRGPVGEGR